MGSPVIDCLSWVLRHALATLATLAEFFGKLIWHCLLLAWDVLMLGMLLASLGCFFWVSHSERQEMFMTQAPHTAGLVVRFPQTIARIVTDFPRSRDAFRTLAATAFLASLIDVVLWALVVLVRLASPRIGGHSHLDPPMRR